MSRMRTTVVIAAAISALAIGGSPALAAESATDAPEPSGGASTTSAGWDHVGTRSFYNTSSYDRTNPVESTGGDFRVCVDVTGYYRLREADSGSADDHVFTRDFVRQVAGECIEWMGIGGYVDGSNQRAEFYVERQNIGAGTAAYYD